MTVVQALDLGDTKYAVVHYPRGTFWPQALRHGYNGTFEYAGGRWVTPEGNSLYETFEEALKKAYVKNEERGSERSRAANKHLCAIYPLIASVTSPYNPGSFEDKLFNLIEHCLKKGLSATRPDEKDLAQFQLHKQLMEAGHDSYFATLVREWARHKKGNPFCRFNEMTRPNPGLLDCVRKLQTRQRSLEEVEDRLVSGDNSLGMRVVVSHTTGHFRAIQMNLGGGVEDLADCQGFRLMMWEHDEAEALDIINRMAQAASELDHRYPGPVINVMKPPEREVMWDPEEMAKARDYPIQVTSIEKKDFQFFMHPRLFDLLQKYCHRDIGRYPVRQHPWEQPRFRMYGYCMGRTVISNPELPAETTKKIWIPPRDGLWQYEEKDYEMCKFFKVPGWDNFRTETVTCVFLCPDPKKYLTDITHFPCA